ncbi:MAG TPA: helix-turn-helix transcriptional regulator [Casimicrobiaceae bacterium]|nr:helix-turn-helix transcriptional regulator [Casimicrobiaceae bacterium]
MGSRRRKDWTDVILDRKTVSMELDRLSSAPPEAGFPDATAQHVEVDAGDNEDARDSLLESAVAMFEDMRRRRAASPEERARRQRSARSLFNLLQQMKCARIQAGYSQAYMAAQLRTSSSAISRLESGLSSRPTLTTIENYAQVLGFAVEIRLTRVARPLSSVPHMRGLC